MALGFDRPASLDLTSVPFGRRKYKALRFAVFETNTPRVNLVVKLEMTGTYYTLDTERGWSPRSGTVLVSDPFSLGANDRKEFEVFIVLSENAPQGTRSGHVTYKLAGVADAKTTFTAKVTPPAIAELALVLDRSASMADPSTVEARTMRLRGAAELCLTLLRNADKAAVVSFNEKGATDVGFGALDDTIGGVTRRAAIANVLAGSQLNPAGMTSIPKAVNHTQGLLGPGEGQSALYLSDGMNDLDDTKTLPAWSGTRFAVGIYNGLPESDIGRANTHLRRVAGTGRVLEWNETGPVAQSFRLNKYVAQTLLNIAGAEVLLDPEGEIGSEGDETFEFGVTEADHSFDIIALSDAPERLRIAIGVPNQRLQSKPELYDEGAPADGGFGGAPWGSRRHKARDYERECDDLGGPRETVGPEYGRQARILRVSSVPIDNDSQRRARTLVARLTAPELATGESIPYSLIVATQSDLRLNAALHSSDLYVGAHLLLSASVSQFDELLREKGTTVHVTLREPDGVTETYELEAGPPGRFSRKIFTFRPGIYEARFIARGRSRLGLRFRREALRTILIRPESARLDPII